MKKAIIFAVLIIMLVTERVSGERLGRAGRLDRLLKMFKSALTV